MWKHKYFILIQTLYKSEGDISLALISSIAPFDKKNIK